MSHLVDEYQRVEVEWFDPHAVAESWTDITQVIAEYKDHPREVCFTLGYQIHEDNENILVAGGVTESQACSVTIIPKTNIIRVVLLYS